MRVLFRLGDGTIVIRYVDLDGTVSIGCKNVPVEKAKSALAFLGITVDVELIEEDFFQGEP